MSTPTIFVVDDDPNILATLRAVIAAAIQRPVRTFSSPRAAIAACALEAPLAVVTDLFMPEMNGVALCEAVRALYPGMPVLLITGHLCQAPATGSAGFDGFLQKPFTMLEFVAALRSLLALRESQGWGAALPSPSAALDAAWPRS